MLPALLQDSPWTAISLLALAAVLAAQIAHRVLRALLRRALRGNTILSAMLGATERAGSATLPLIALQAVWEFAPDTLEFIRTVRHLNLLLLIGAATWLALSVVGGVAQGVALQYPVDAEDNLHARRIQTQASVLARSAMVLLVIAGSAMALMTFPGARQVGASLLASAGVLGLVAGLAARPVFSNLIAGLQLAISQPIRLDDVLIVKGENGRVEEITGSYVVLRIWDDRRMVVPLQWFIENPFENWTRTNAALLGTVVLHLDFRTPVQALREQAERAVKADADWDGRVFNLQVQDATERAMQVRVLLSAANAGKLWDLRCRVREQLIGWLQREHPDSLPLVRVDGAPGAAAATGAAG